MRDVDFSPDGSYFVIVTTGGPNFGTLCDTAARWETNAQGTALQPTWVDATGGDTLSAVGVTGSVVYVGGHQRWMNNWFGRDSAGPGAVSRPGIAALDPVNGLPFSWNPGRDRGAGVFALYSTNTGLWMGHDTDRVAGELRRKIAFFPLAGGKIPPPTDPYTLPGDLYNVPIGPAPINALPRRPFDGSTIGAVSNLSTPSTDWSTTRGIFALQGELFSGSSNGTFVVRAFDGTSVGPAQPVNLNGLTDFPVQSLTGLFYANGRIYYTVSGDSRMFFRYFTPESRIVGSDRWIVGALTPPVDWSLVRGMTLANGKLYFARANGNLYSMGFANGAPVGGTEVLISPASDGFNWASNGLFVFTHVTAGSAVFSDDFSSANFSKWTGVTNLTIDNSKGGVAPPSALAQPSAQTAFAFKTLSATLSLDLHERQGERRGDRPELDDPAPAADGGQRPDHEGLHQRQWDPVRQVRRLEHPALLGRRPGERMAHHRAVRHGRGVRHVGSVPRWRQDRERLDREHRHDAGRQGGDRQRAGRDRDDQLRRHRRRSDARLRRPWGADRMDPPLGSLKGEAVPSDVRREARDEPSGGKVDLVVSAALRARRGPRERRSPTREPTFVSALRMASLLRPRPSGFLRLRTPAGP